MRVREPGHFKQMMRVGLAVRGVVKRALQRAAWDYDVSLDLTEAKGWLGSDLYLDVSGTEHAVEAFAKWLDDYQDRIGRHR